MPRYRSDETWKNVPGFNKYQFSDTRKLRVHSNRRAISLTPIVTQLEADDGENRVVNLYSLFKKTWPELVRGN